MRGSLIVLIFFIHYLVFGQGVFFSGELITTSDHLFLKSSDTKVLKVPKKFNVYEINTSNIYNFSKKTNNSNKIKFQLALGAKHKWQMVLTEHFLFSENFRRVEQTNKGRKISYTPPELKTFRGFNTSKDQIVTLSLGPNWIYGKIKAQNGGYHFIEPLRFYDLNAKSNHYVVYTSDKTIASDYECGQNEISITDIPNNIKNPSSSATCLEIAIAYDQSTKIEFGGVSATENILTSRFNEVGAFFFDNFEIDKKIIEFYESRNNEITPDNNTVACYEISPNNCGNRSILDDFREWGERKNEPNFGFSSNPDAATFFTNRNVMQYDGYSYIGGICSEIGYNWVNEANNLLEYRKVNLWIHEYGHTWNATHVDDSEIRNMMHRRISSASPMEVSNETNNQIISHKNIVGCLNNDVCSTLDTNEFELHLLNIMLFPNPTTNTLNVKTNRQLKKVEIFNYLGQKILVKEEDTFNTSKLKNGVYILKVFSAKGDIGIKKFIKEQSN